MPAVISMMTHPVSEREQSELQDALQSMRSITFIIGPWLFLQIFGWFIDPKNKIHLPGAPYYLAAALLFTAMLMSTRIKQTPLEPHATIVPSVPLTPPEVTATGAAPIAEAEENIRAVAPHARLRKYEIQPAWRNRRGCDLFVVCDFKSL